MPEFSNPFRNAKVVGHGIDPEAYHGQLSGIARGHKDFVMSRGELMTFNECPSKWIKGFVRKDTDSTDWGNLIDCLLLDGERFADKFAIAPKTYLADGKKKLEPQIEKPWNRNATVCREWEELQKPRTIIKAEENAEAEAALKFLCHDPEIVYLLKESQKQVMVVGEYVDRETGFVIPVKILIDLVPTLASRYDKTLIDFKTAVSTNPATWAKDAFRYNYHVQGAFYTDLYVAATGEDRVEFAHIVQENVFPFEPGKHVLAAEFLELGRLTYIGALRKYCQCLQTDIWPSYAPARVCLNGWSYAQVQPYMVNQ